MGIASLEVLFPGAGSGVSLVTAAVFWITAAAEAGTVPRRRITLASPGSRVPRGREGVQGCQLPPLSSDHSRLFKSGGCGSSSTTFTALEGPALAAARVYVTRSPGRAGLGAPVLTSDRSASSPMGTSTVSVLLDRSGS